MPLPFDNLVALLPFECGPGEGGRAPVRAHLDGRQRAEHDVVDLAWQLLLDRALLGPPQKVALC